MSVLRSWWAETPAVAEPFANNTGEVIHAAATWANDIHLSLSGIQYNTSQLFFWTMFGAIAGLGVIMLRTLNDLLHQLKDTNRHQVAYRQMWADERHEMHDQIRADEQARHRMFSALTAQMRAMNQSLNGVGGSRVGRSGGGGGAQARKTAAHGNISDETRARMQAKIREAAANLPASFGTGAGPPLADQGPVGLEPQEWER